MQGGNKSWSAGGFFDIEHDDSFSFQPFHALTAGV
jgi:hypothetical protein